MPKSKVYVRLIEFKSGKRVVIEERFGAIGRLNGQKCAKDVGGVWFHWSRLDTFPQTD